MIVSDQVAEPFMGGKEMFAHGSTFAGHPVGSAVAMANLDVFEREGLNGHVLRKQGELRGMLDGLKDIPIVGDVRGDGFFHAIELVKDQGTKESFNDEESEWLLRGFLSCELFRRGLICRADDRGDPVIQLAPTLVCDTEQFEEIENVLRPVLTEASERVRKVSNADGRQPRRRLWPRAGRRGGWRRAPDSLGPHLGARGPDPVALRRRAASHHRNSASLRRTAQTLQRY